jgi:excisionase family DNA binding protein
MTTIEAAEALHVTRGRVCQLITAGRLKAKRIGRDWHIEPAALGAVRVRKPGRPSGKKTSTNDRRLNIKNLVSTH